MEKIIAGVGNWVGCSGGHGKNLLLTGAVSLLCVRWDVIPFILALVCLITSLAVLFLALTGHQTKLRQRLRAAQGPLSSVTSVVGPIRMS